MEKKNQKPKNKKDSKITNYNAANEFFLYHYVNVLKKCNTHCKSVLKCSNSDPKIKTGPQSW